MEETSGGWVGVEVGIVETGFVGSRGVGVVVEIGAIAAGSTGNCGNGVGAVVHAAMSISGTAKEPAKNSTNLCR